MTTPAQLVEKITNDGLALLRDDVAAGSARTGLVSLDERRARSSLSSTAVGTRSRRLSRFQNRTVSIDYYVFDPGGGSLSRHDGEGD